MCHANTAHPNVCFSGSTQRSVVKTVLKSDLSLLVRHLLRNRLQTITQKMADQERSDFYVVFTMILCALKSLEILITLLSELLCISNKNWCLGKQVNLQNPTNFRTREPSNFRTQGSFIRIEQQNNFRTRPSFVR